MDWKEILAIIIPIVVSILPPLSVMLIKWLKTQSFIQKAHLEDIVATLIPQIVEWVEYWAEQIGKNGSKPTSEEKLEKAKEFLAKELPEFPVTSEVELRIENALKKIKNGK